MDARTPDFYLRTSSYDYDLPQELIAQHPADRRDASRLLVCGSDKSLSDRAFCDLTDYLKPGDLIVINETKVLPVRLHLTSERYEKPVEFLLLKEVSPDVWECLAKPGKHAKEGQSYRVSDAMSATVTGVLPDGNRLLSFTYDQNTPFVELLERYGEVPLPPYIHEKIRDKSRYQTVYAKNPGSAAAPTAGFHFTKELMDRAREKGASFCPVTLSIGLGTFRPVKTEDLSRHKMHSEHFEISEEAANAINRAKAEGRRVIAVGTTSCRTLESAWDEKTQSVRALSGDTELFIHPGFCFHVLDGLITNFHLPQSTLLMLVCAFWGYDDTMRAYRHAVEKRYRFFSFGDACLFL